MLTMAVFQTTVRRYTVSLIEVKGLTFIYRCLQGNQNSSGLQLELVY